jgi:hypothetical protein
MCLQWTPAGCGGHFVVASISEGVADSGRQTMNMLFPIREQTSCKQRRFRDQSLHLPAPLPRTMMNKDAVRISV